MRKITLLAFLFLFACGEGRLSPQGGTVTSVQGGNGLTGGASGGAVTLNVVATTGGGLSVLADSVGLLNSCSSSEILKWNGSAWACSADSGATGTGTTNKLVKWTGTTTQGDSQWTDNGTLTTATGDVTFNFGGIGTTTVAGNFLVNSGSTVTIGSASSLAAPVTITSATQLVERIRLSGQEFYQPAHTDTDGVALALGQNRTGNRAVWLMDSAAMTQNSSNAALQFQIQSGTVNIDAFSTDGGTAKALNFQSTGGPSVFGAGAFYVNGNATLGDNTASDLTTVNGNLALTSTSSTVNGVTITKTASSSTTSYIPGLRVLNNGSYNTTTSALNAVAVLGECDASISAGANALMCSGIYGYDDGSSSATDRYAVRGVTTAGAGTNIYAGGFTNASAVSTYKWGVSGVATGDNGTKFGGYFGASGTGINWALYTTTGDVALNVSGGSTQTFGNTTLGDATTDTATVNGKLQVNAASGGQTLVVTGVTNGLNDGIVKVQSNKNAWGTITGQLTTTAGGSTSTDKLTVSVDSGSLNFSSGGLADALVIAHAGGGTFASTLAVNGNTTLGDNSGTDSLTVKQGAATTASAAPAGTVVAIEQAAGANAYLTFRQTDAQKGLEFANSSAGNDGFFVYNGSRSFLYGTGGTVRQEIDVNGSTLIGDTTNTAVANNVDVLTIGNTGTGQTTTGKSLITGSNTGSYDTTTGALETYGANFSVTSTRSAGANNLTNIAVRAGASGAQSNYSFVGTAGILYNVGNITTDGAFTENGSPVLSGTISANTIPKGSGGNLADSSITDDGSDVKTSLSTWAGLDTGTSSKKLNVGRDTALTTNAQNGWSVNTYSDGNVYIDGKTWSGGSIFFRSGGGAAAGSNNTWMTVATTGPTVTLSGTSVTSQATTTTATGALNVNGNATLGDTSGDVHTVHGQIQQTDDGNAFDVRSTPVAATANTYAAFSQIAGTIDATSGNRIAYGVIAESYSTKSAGANSLTDYAVYADASGGTTNFAVYADRGDNSLGHYFYLRDYDTDVADGSTVGSQLISRDFALQIWTGGLVVGGGYANNATPAYCSATGALCVAGKINTTNTGTGGYQIDGVDTLYRATTDGHLYVVNPYNVAGAGSYHVILKPSSTQGDVRVQTNATNRVNVEETGAIEMGDAASTTQIDNNVDVLTIGNTGTGQTTSSKSLINLSNTGTYDATAGNVVVNGLSIGMSSSRSAGANSVINNGLYVAVSGAQGNRAITADVGDVYLNATSGTTGIGTAPTSTFKLSVASAPPSASFIANNSGLMIADTNSAGTGVGGGLELQGAYTGTTTTVGAVFKTMKANGTAGDYDFDLALGTRRNTVSDITKRLVIDATGATNMLGQAVGVQGSHVGWARDFADMGYTGFIRKNLTKYSRVVGNDTAADGQWRHVNVGSTLAYTTSSQTSPAGYAESVGQITCTNGGTACTAGGSDYRVIDTVTSTTIEDTRGLTFTLSVWVKAASGTNTNFTLQLGRYNDTEATATTCAVNSTTWTRCTYTKTMSSTNLTDNSEVRAYLLPLSTTAHYIYGAQLEVNADATPWEETGDTLSSGAYLARRGGLAAYSTGTGTALDNAFGSWAYSLSGGCQASTGYCSPQNAPFNVGLYGDLVAPTGTFFVANNGDILYVENTGTGNTTDAKAVGRFLNAGSYNTTSAALTEYGVYSSMTATRSAGANALTNVGGYFAASGAQNNLPIIASIGTPSGVALSNAGTAIEVQSAGSQNLAITFRQGNNDGTSNINFANSGAGQDGAVSYSNSLRGMQFMTATTYRQYINSSGQIFFGDATGAAVDNNLDVITVGNTGTGQTGHLKSVIAVSNSGSYDATSASKDVLGVSSIMTSSRSAGANQVNNFGFYADVSGAQGNYAFYANQGLSQFIATNITGTLQATGNTTLGDANTDTITITGKINSNVHYTGTAPTIGTCGTSPSVTGNNHAGTVTIGTGTATSCTVTFSVAYTTNAPACVVTHQINTGSVLYFSAKSTSAFTVTTSAGTNLAGGKFDYICDGIL